MEKTHSHPPLRRVSHGPRVPVNTGEQPRMLGAPLFHKSLTDQGSEAQQDSCYSSCSDSDHSSLSRETSDTLAQEYQQQSLASPTSLLSTDLNTLMLTDCKEYQRLREFTLRLGYQECQLQFILDKLGNATLPGQDKVLAELIKLGKHDTTQPSTSANASTGHQLRSVVIDGSNIAMTHGRKEVFSCLGIRESVDFFRNRGHSDIKVFVPQFRREAPRSDCPITDQHILLDLDQEGMLVWTPSRRVGGRRIVCHDDRYILKTAAEKDAVIVSNDEYRDLIKETPAFRRLVEERLLMYSFVDGNFMPPDDPLGRHGPKLDQFLSKGGAGAAAALCPYGRKCTYGNKCKYFHPERPGGIHVSVTERLMNRKPPLSLSTSLAYEAMANRLKPAATRTRSLNLPVSISVTETCRLPAPTSSPLTSTHSLISKKNSNPEQLSPLSMPPPDPSPYPPLLTVPQQTDWSWPYHHHQALNRNLSAPGPGNGPPPLAPMVSQCRFEDRKNSVSDSQLNWVTGSGDKDLWRTASNDSAFGSEGSASHQSNFYIPSTAVWGPKEFSVGPVSPSQPLTSQSMTLDHSDRTKLFYHLSQLFPESVVVAVMTAHPDEYDAQVLCARILAVQQGFGRKF